MHPLAKTSEDSLLNAGLTNTAISVDSYASEKFLNLMKIKAKLFSYDNEDIVLAAMYHDIGKCFIPSQLLKKPGPLTSLEYEVVKMHTVSGSLLLEDEAELFDEQLANVALKYNLPCEVLVNPVLKKKASAIAMFHHEKWDGTGYPHGLCGDEIPFDVQVVSIADVIDALFSKRSYKEPWSAQDVFDFLVRQSGSQFSPYVVNQVKNNFSQIEALYCESNKTYEKNECS
ncbi:HD domain-containing phosphohydrolase [Vibrio coralliirubri]|uniref:HD-GYP domain-containing protein n=1 Tax=Vibrio coralliirubri TaxID=1516159 RepID=UPI002FCFBB4D